jgi:hypothetical protein
MAEQVVTQLIVDANQARSGLAVYEQAMNAVNAARERLNGADQRATAAQQAQITATTMLSTTIQRAQQQWDKLRASTDASVAAVMAYDKAVTTAARTADASVQRRITNEQQAKAVLEETIRMQQQLYQNAGAPRGGANDPSQILGLTGSIKDAARASAVVFEEEFSRLETIARQKAEQAGAAFQQGLNQYFGVGGAISKSARESAAVFSEEFDRLDNIARLKAEQVGQAFQAGLNQSFGIGGGISKSARDAASVFQEEFNRLDDIARLKAQQIGANFQAGLNQSFGIGSMSKSARDSASAFEEVFKEQEKLATSAMALRGEINPLGAAQTRLNDRLAEYQKLAAAGHITTEELATASQRAQVQFKLTENSLRGAGSGAKFTSSEIANLGFQLNDIVTGVLLGQSPFMIMAQQGGQVYGILQNSTAAAGGLGASLRALGGWVISLFTPMVSIILGVGAAVLTVVAAFNSWTNAQLEVTRGLSGIGRASQVTREQINQLASDKSTPLGLSVKEARETATALAATGRVGAVALGALVGLAHDFAKTLGVDSTEAAKQLADALSSPVKGAEDLNSKLGFMDAAMQRQISNLTAQNKLAEAQKLIIDGIASSVANANDVTGFWAKTWTAIANAISNAYTGLGQILAKATGVGETLEDQYVRAKKRLDELTAAQQKFGTVSVPEDPAGRAALRNRRGVVSGGPTDAELSAAQAAFDQVTEKIKKTADAAADAKRRLDSLFDRKTLDQFLPEIQALQDRINQLSVAGRVSEDPVLLRSLGLTQEQVDRAKAILGQLVSDFKTAFQGIQISARIAFDAITAFSPAAKGAIAFRQEEERLRTATDLSPEQKKLAAEYAYVNAVKTATTALSEAARERKLAANQSVDSAKLEVDLIGKNVGEQARLRADLQAKQQLEQEASRNRTAFDQAQFESLKKINAEAAKLAQQRAVKELFNTAEFDRATLFFSDTERQVASLLKTVHGNEWRNFMDGPLAGMLRFNIIMKDVIDQAGQFASGFIKDVANGIPVLTALATQAKRLAESIIDIATKRIVQNALGNLVGDTASMSVGATSAAGILTTAGATVGAAIVAGATEAAAILGLTIPSAAATLPVAGAVTGAEVAVGGAVAGTEIAAAGVVSGGALAVGGAAAGTALAAGGAAAGTAIYGPIAILIAAVAALGALTIFGGSKEDPLQKAKDNFAKMSDQVRNFNEAASGFDLSPFVTAIQQIKNTALDLIKAAIEAQDAAKAVEIIFSAVKQVNNQVDQFIKPKGNSVDDQIANENAQAHQLIDELNDLNAKYHLGLDRTKDILAGAAAHIAEIQRKAEEEIEKRRIGFQDRMFAALHDTESLEDKLALFDRQAQREREDETKAGGQAMVDLDAALAKERLNVIRDFNSQAVENEKKAAADRLTAINDSAKGIVDYLNGLVSGPSSTLSPTATLANAQDVYNKNLGLAQGGNIDAQNKFVSLADNLEKAARAVYASGQGYQDIRSQIISQGLALPAVQQTTDPVVVAMRDVLAAIQLNGSTQARDATLTGVLKTAIDAGNAQAVAAVLLTDGKIPTDGLNFADFVSGLGPKYADLAKVGSVSSLLTKQQMSDLGLKADGTVSGLLTADLLLQKLSATLPATSTLGGLLTKTQLQAAGLSSETTLGTLFTAGDLTAAALAKEDKGNLLKVFNELDGNGNGILEKSEAIKSATQGTASNTDATATNTGGGPPLGHETQWHSQEFGTMTSLLDTSKTLLQTIQNQLVTSSINGGLLGLGGANSAVPNNNNLLTALNKIVYNTAQTAIATSFIAGATTGHTAAYAAGGTIPAFGLGLVSEHLNPTFLRAGPEPIHVFPGTPSNDNSALLAEVKRLNDKIDRLERVVAGSGANIARAVVESGAHVADTVETQTDTLAAQERQSSRQRKVA